MSVYTAISKKIGWQGQARIPSLTVARSLLMQITKYKDVRAFEAVFAIHRFAPSPQTVEEGLAMNEVNKAFHRGRKDFQK